MIVARRPDGPRDRRRPARRLDAARAARDARGRAAPARVPRLAFGGVALVPLLQRRRQSRCAAHAGRRARRPLAARGPGPEDTVVGHGTYVGGRERAEVAFAVADAWQGHGIATILLAHLAQAASAAGHRDVHGDRAVSTTAGCSRCSTTPGSPCRAPRRRTASRSRSRRRCRARPASASRSASASPTSRRSPTCCGRRRSRSSAPRAGPARSAARSCATCSPAGFSGPLHLVNAKGGEVAGRPTVRCDRRRRGGRRARGHRRAGGRGRRDRARSAPPRACGRSSC